MKREALTNAQVILVKQRAADIWSEIAGKGDTCYSYGGDYHFWWDGLPHGHPLMNTVRGGLVNLDDDEDAWLSLSYFGYLKADERTYWKVIAKEFQDIAQSHCYPIPNDPRLDIGLLHCRSKHMKHITAMNYTWEWLHDTHTTMTI
ncbi:MAG TPA: hypothetical protein VGL38_08125 [bacterium]